MPGRTPPTCEIDVTMAGCIFQDKKWVPDVLVDRLPVPRARTLGSAAYTPTGRAIRSTEAMMKAKLSSSVSLPS